MTVTEILRLVETLLFRNSGNFRLTKCAPYSWLPADAACTTGSCTERNKSYWICGWWCSPPADNLSFWNVFNPLLSRRTDFWQFALLTRSRLLTLVLQLPSVHCVLLHVNKASPDSLPRRTRVCLCQGWNTGECRCEAAQGAVLVPLLVLSFSVTGCFSSAVP